MKLDDTKREELIDLALGLRSSITSLWCAAPEMHPHWRGLINEDLEALGVLEDAPVHREFGHSLQEGETANDK